MILGISTPSIRDRRRLKLNSFTGVRCSPNARGTHVAVEPIRWGGNKLGISDAAMG